MKRTRFERLIGRFFPDRILRRDPDFPGLALFGNGLLRLDLPNPVWGGRSYERSFSGWEGDEMRLVRLCVDHDDMVRGDMSDSDAPPPVRDLGLRYAATLSSGRVIARVPKGREDIFGVAGIESFGISFVLLPAGAALPQDLDALNAEEHAKEREMRAWTDAVSPFNGYRELVSVRADSLTVYPDPRRADRSGAPRLTQEQEAHLNDLVEASRLRLVRAGGDVAPDGGVRFPQDVIMNSRAAITDLVIKSIKETMEAVQEFRDAAMNDVRWNAAQAVAAGIPGFEAVPQAIIITVPLDKGEILRGLLSLGGELLLNDRVRMGRADFLAADLSVEAIAEALNPAEEVSDAPEDLFGIPGA